MVLGVDTGEHGNQAVNARQFRDKHGLTYPILLDAGDKIAAQYGVTGFPTNLVIDRKGIVRLAEGGYNPPALDQEINRLLNSP